MFFCLEMHANEAKGSIQSRIDLFTDTAAILNSIVLTEKLWAAEGAIAGKFIVYTAFRINFYCLSLIFHNKYYKVTSFRHDIWQLFLWLSKNYC